MLLLFLLWFWLYYLHHSFSVRKKKKSLFQKLIKWFLQLKIEYIDKYLKLSVCLWLLLSWILWNLTFYFHNVSVLILFDFLSLTLSDSVSLWLPLSVTQTELLLMKKFLKLHERKETLCMLKYMQNLWKNLAEKLAEQNYISFHWTCIKCLC